MVGEASTPVTMAPVAASCSVRAPSPQPRSRISSPGWGLRRATTSEARVATKRPLAAYASVFQVWPVFDLVVEFIAPLSCLRVAMREEDKNLQKMDKREGWTEV